MGRTFKCENCGSIVELGLNGDGDHNLGYSCFDCGYVHYPKEGAKMDWVKVEPRHLKMSALEWMNTDLFPKNVTGMTWSSTHIRMHFKNGTVKRIPHDEVME